jgi:hypothetical protein
MKPQQTENKKKLSTIARRIKKGLPLTGLISTLLAATGCMRPTTVGRVPSKAGDIPPCPDNAAEEVRKTSETRPVPGEPPVVQPQLNIGEIAPLAGKPASLPDEKTKEPTKETENTPAKPAIKPRPLAGVPPRPQPPKDAKTDN